MQFGFRCAIIKSQQGNRHKNQKRKEEKIMTKKEIVKHLETSKKIVDFDEKYLMRQSKERLESLYNNIICTVPKAQ